MTRRLHKKLINPDNIWLSGRAECRHLVVSGVFGPACSVFGTVLNESGTLHTHQFVRLTVIKRDCGGFERMLEGLVLLGFTTVSNLFQLPC